MDMAFTAYLWLNWLIVSFLVGAGFALGGAVVAAILGLLHR
jgi:hypothetical protein